jgi:hypothetical protein
MEQRYQLSSKTLTGGQRHDITQADDLIAALEFERINADARMTRMSS